VFVFRVYSISPSLLYIFQAYHLVNTLVSVIGKMDYHDENLHVVKKTRL
jgi:hypothetical protein